jgi:hypothetical protein
MRLNRRYVRWLLLTLVALGVAAVAAAPSWRNYYLRRGAC